MKRYLPFIIVGAVALATLASGTMLYLQKRPHLLTIPQKLSAKGDAIHIRGNPDAPVTLEEFGDYQCPPCGTIAPVIDQLTKEYDRRLRLVFRNFPLPTHVHGRDAALAAEAAGLQGRFWDMHDVLFREQATWAKATNARELFDRYAGMLGLNLDQFKKDMTGEKARARVDSDQERGRSLGVKNTPTLFVNNREVPPPNLREAVDAAVKPAAPASNQK